MLQHIAPTWTILLINNNTTNCRSVGRKGRCRAIIFVSSVCFLIRFDSEIAYNGMLLRSLKLTNGRLSLPHVTIENGRKLLKIKRRLNTIRSCLPFFRSQFLSWLESCHWVGSRRNFATAFSSENWRSCQAVKDFDNMFSRLTQNRHRRRVTDRRTG